MPNRYHYINNTHRIQEVETKYNGTLYYPQYYTISFKRWVNYTEGRQPVQCKTLLSAQKHIQDSLRWFKEQGM